MNRILLIESADIHPHLVRAASRRAGVCLVYESADTREGFLRLLARGPVVVASSLKGLAELSFEELAGNARAAEVPVLVVGGDTEEEARLLEERRGMYRYSCRRSRMQWLPSLLERIVRGAAEHQEWNRRSALDEAAAQVLRSAEQIREVQRLATIGRLTSSVVHEINNPLESITNLIYLLDSDEQLPGHMRPYLELIQGELRRVGQISKQTLTFCRETQSMVRVEISSLLDEVLVLFGRRLSEKRIEMVREFEEEEPVLVFPGEMRQVYSNLIANAIEASEPGGRIVVRLHRSKRWNGKDTAGMRVLVADNGCGMQEHVRAKLGQPFYTTKGQRGTGLGLWVSRTILQRYGAEMRLRSSVAPERHGTTFSVFVPFVHRARVVEIAAPGAKVGDGQPGNGEAGELIRLRASSS